MTITLERLKELVTYAPETGLFYWKIKPRGGCKGANIGDVAGTIQKTGKGKWNYRTVCLDQKVYYAHRLAWFYMTGKWPPKYVDHINCDGCDNRWENLRLANNSQNGYNARLSKRNKFGFKGVYLNKRDGTYSAEIRNNWQKYHLGNFKTPEEAHQAYVAAAAKFGGEFARFS